MKENFRDLLWIINVIGGLRRLARIHKGLARTSDDYVFSAEIKSYQLLKMSPYYTFVSPGKRLVVPDLGLSTSKYRRLAGSSPIATSLGYPPIPFLSDLRVWRISS